MIFWQLVVEGGADVAGAEVNHLDAERLKFHREAGEERAEGGLARAVVGREGHGQFGGEGADADDDAAAAFAEMGGGELQDLERAVDEDAPLVAGVLAGDLLDRAEDAGAGVLDDDVDVAGLAERFGPRGVDGGGVLELHLDRVKAGPGGQAIPAATGAPDKPAFAGEELRRGAADAGTGPGEKNVFATHAHAEKHRGPADGSKSECGWA